MILNKIVSELRLRIEKEVLHPLVVLEQMPVDNPHSFELIDKVMADFRKANEKVWNEVSEKIQAKCAI